VLENVSDGVAKQAEVRVITACANVTRFVAGKQTWQVPIRGEGLVPNEWVTRGLSIADLSGDGHPDLAYLTSRGYFRVIDERDGKPLFEFDGAGVLAEGQRASDGSHSRCWRTSTEMGSSTRSLWSEAAASAKPMARTRNVTVSRCASRVSQGRPRTKTGGTCSGMIWKTRGIRRRCWIRLWRNTFR
jgi:hypothetical protein